MFSVYIVFHFKIPKTPLHQILSALYWIPPAYKDLLDEDCENLGKLHSAYLPTEIPFGKIDQVFSRCISLYFRPSPSRIKKKVHLCNCTTVGIPLFQSGTNLECCSQWWKHNSTKLEFERIRVGYVDSRMNSVSITECKFEDIAYRCRYLQRESSWRQIVITRCRNSEVETRR